MQNKTINTVFLGIIIILLAVGVWFLAKGNDSSYIEKNPVTDTDKKPVEKEKVPDPIVKKPDPTITFLKGLIKNQPNSGIKECSYQNKKYFSFHMNMGATDASPVIYDVNGVLVASGPSPMMPNPTIDPIYANISATCTKVVYAWPWGTASPSVDIYNLK